MVDNITSTNTSSEPQTSNTVSSGSKVATETAAKSAPATSKASGYTTKTEIKSLADLRNKAPEVFKAMMRGIATTIIKQNQRSQDRLEKMWREARNS